MHERVVQIVLEAFDAVRNDEDRLGIEEEDAGRFIHKQLHGIDIFRLGCGRVGDGQTDGFVEGGIERFIVPVGEVEERFLGVIEQ